MGRYIQVSVSWDLSDSWVVNSSFALITLCPLTAHVSLPPHVLYLRFYFYSGVFCFENHFVYSLSPTKSTKPRLFQRLWSLTQRRCSSTSRLALVIVSPSGTERLWLMTLSKLQTRVKFKQVLIKPHATRLICAQKRASFKGDILTPNDVFKAFH